MLAPPPMEELTAMFNMGLIEESHNDWSCPVVLFPRADGSVRFCSDFTNVNMVSKFDAYPMPHTDELLSLSDMARFYSKLELKRDIGSLDSHTSEENGLFNCIWFTPNPQQMDRILRVHAA